MSDCPTSPSNYPAGGGYCPGPASALIAGVSFNIIGPGVLTASGLPDGLDFPGIFGDDWITGTPTTVGTYDGFINDLPTRWVVAGAVGVNDWTPGQAVVNTMSQWLPSTLALTATAGVPLSFQLYYSFCADACPGLGTTPQLPPGLTLHSDGSITGIPNTAGAYVAEIVVLGAFGASLGALQITILAAPPPPGPVPPDVVNHIDPSTLPISALPNPAGKKMAPNPAGQLPSGPIEEC